MILIRFIAMVVYVAAILLLAAGIYVLVERFEEKRKERENGQDLD